MSDASGTPTNVPDSRNNTTPTKTQPSRPPSQSLQTASMPDPPPAPVVPGPDAQPSAGSA